MLTPVVEDEPAAREWNARLELEYELRGNETVLVRRTHVGPLRVQRPFLETNGVCQTYVIHPPGGLVGGDTLEVQAFVGAGARALITTPGASKFYRSPHARAVQRHDVHVAADASIEWFPQETIVFDGASAASYTRLHVQESSKCALWEITCLGRPAAKLPFASGLLTQRLELETERRPILLESLRVGCAHVGVCDCKDGMDALGATWGLQGLPVFGTMLLHPLPKELLSAARFAVSDHWSANSEHRFGASQLPYSTQESTIVCRYLGTSAEHCKHLFVRIWRALRPHLLGIEAEPPRVWHT